MTHHLASLASGRLVIALEGGYNLDTLAEAGAACAHALLGHVAAMTRVNVTPETRADPGAVESVGNVIRAHSKYWKCPQSMLSKQQIDMIFNISDGVGINISVLFELILYLTFNKKKNSKAKKKRFLYRI